MLIAFCLRYSHFLNHAVTIFLCIFTALSGLNYVESFNQIIIKKQIDLYIGSIAANSIFWLSRYKN